LLLSNRIALLKKFLPALVLALAIFAVYAPALRNDFVWDDTALILRDPLIRSWQLVPEAFQHFLFIDATPSDFYRPVQRLTYLVDYAAFVFKPAGYHLTSILCHVGATLALLLLANELLRGWNVEERTRRRLAFLAALVWAVHPAHTAAVAYISGRADPLAAMFGFLGLYCGIRALPQTRANRWLLLIATAALFLWSALSKETGLIFPILWLAILLLRKSWRQVAPAIVVTLFVAVSYLSLRLPAEHFPAPRLRPPAPLLVRPIIFARAFAEYTGLILFPANLHMDRDVESHPFGPSDASVRGAAWRELETLLGIVLIAAAIYWLIRSRKQDPAIFGCLVLAALGYIPVSGAFSLNASIAEHWLYLPMAFLLLAAAMAISRIRIPRLAIISVLAVWLVFLGARTFVHTLDWKNQRTFLERTIAAGGDSARMLINLASQELHEGQLDSAKKHLEAALEKEPNQPFAVINLAVVAIRKEDYATAREILNRAKDLPLVDAQAHELLGILEVKEHDRVELLRFRLASRTGPPNWRIERRYIEALDQTGNTSAAIQELAACLKTQWYRAESWQLLSDLFTKAGPTREGMEALEQAKDYDVHLMEHAEVPQSQ
jgi:tetratricopeptide (TPR) repeat protein